VAPILETTLIPALLNSCSGEGTERRKAGQIQHALQRKLIWIPMQHEVLANLLLHHRQRRKSGRRRPEEQPGEEPRQRQNAIAHHARQEGCSASIAQAEVHIFSRCALREGWIADVFQITALREIDTEREGSAARRDWTRASPVCPSRTANACAALKSTRSRSLRLRATSSLRRISEGDRAGY